MDGETDSRAEMLRAFLAEHDEACPGCGYNLRGLAAGACPECGEELRLRVGREVPAVGWHAAGLIGISMALGFNLVASLFLVPVEPESVPVLLPGLALSLAALCGWLLGHRRLTSANVYTRSTLTTLAALLPIFSLVLMLVVAAVWFE